MKSIYKLIIDIGPLAVFFIFYSRSGLQASILPFMIATIIAVLISYILEKKIPIMPTIGASIVLVFGGLTIYFDNEVFFKMKPTLVYFLFGFVLLVGLLRGKSYLESLMGTMLPMEREGWMIISRRITGFFFFLGLLNEFVWRTFSTEVWVYFKTFGLSVALLIFLASQYPVLLKYGDFDNDDKN